MPCECEKKPPTRRDAGKSARGLLEEYVRERGFSSPNQIGAIYELALPVVEWLMAEKGFKAEGAL